MVLNAEDDRSSSNQELSDHENEDLEEEELLRQFSERLKGQFKATLSEPIPADIIRLVDQLEENER